MLQKLYNNKLIIIFFLSYLIIGLLIFKDYGAGWDELFQNGIGWVNIAYIVGHNPYLHDPSNFTKYYGPVFEMFTFWLGMLLGIFKLSGHPLAYGSPSQSGILLRHLMDFLAFFAGSIFFYLLCRKNKKNKLLSILCTIFLILSPRIFADSFYNSKDTVFLAFFIINIYFLINFLGKKSIKNIVLLGIISAITIDIRNLAIIIPLFVGLIFILDFVFYKKQRKEIKRTVILLALYFVLTSVLVVILMPYLWNNPLRNFIEMWVVFSHYPQQIPDLYLGKYVLATQLPWHYIPVWIFITTPPLYSIFFIIGAIYLIYKTKDFRSFYLSNQNNLIFFLWFFLPITMIIILRSNLYNAWRQMFFVYPAFLLISLEGLIYLYKILKKHKYLIGIFYLSIIFSLLNTVRTMINLHPYENLYFNIFAGPNMRTISRNFETDYWGLSYKKGLEYILNHDSRKKIYILAENDPARTNSLLLSDNERKRLYFYDGIQNVGKVDYYMTDYFSSRKELPYKEFYSVIIDGAKIMTVYKLR